MKNKNLNRQLLYGILDENLLKSKLQDGIGYPQ